MLFALYIFSTFHWLYFVEGSVFRYDYHYHEDSNAWFKFHTERRSWHEARRACEMEGATLASPISKAFTKAILDFTDAYHIKVIFVGVHDTFSNGVWQSIEGVPLPGFDDKVVYESNLDSNSSQQCAVLDCESLVSSECAERYSFVCYKRDAEVTEPTACGTMDRGMKSQTNSIRTPAEVPAKTCKYYVCLVLSQYELDTRTGSCYKFHIETQPWWKAYEICSAEGAYLAVVNSVTESEVLRELYQRIKPDRVDSEHPDFASVGVIDWEHTSDWYTIHGQRLKDSGYFTWKHGEPNGKDRGEFCGSLHKNGGLNDISCQIKLLFVCEKDMKIPKVTNKKELPIKNILQ